MKVIDSRHQCLLAIAIGLSILPLAGCGQPATTSNPSVDASDSGQTAEKDAHPTEGPHGGTLIELGKEAYHAELIHEEDKGSLTVYLLDSAAKKPSPIEATDIQINLTHDGTAEQFKLEALRTENDPEGVSSRFVSSEAELAEDLDREGAEAQLVVKINDKQYRGEIAHEH